MIPFGEIPVLMRGAKMYCHRHPLCWDPRRAPTASPQCRRGSSAMRRVKESRRIAMRSPQVSAVSAASPCSKHHTPSSRGEPSHRDRSSARYSLQRPRACRTATQYQSCDCCYLHIKKCGLYTILIFNVNFRVQFISI